MRTKHTFRLPPIPGDQARRLRFEQKRVPQALIVETALILPVPDSSERLEGARSPADWLIRQVERLRHVHHLNEGVGALRTLLADGYSTSAGRCAKRARRTRAGSVRKVTSRHSGDVWQRSNLGRGSPRTS